MIWIHCTEIALFFAWLIFMMQLLFQIDLAHADVDKISQQLESVFGFMHEKILKVCFCFHLCMCKNDIGIYICCYEYKK